MQTGNGAVKRKFRPLSPEERRVLERCEKTIEAGAVPFVKVGLALAQIKHDQLYRETHGSFGEYCIDRFDFQRAHAYRLLNEAEMVVELEEACKNGEKVQLPRNEGQARELLSVPSEQRLEVLRIASRSAETGDLSARLIREAMAKLTGDPAPSHCQKKTTTRFSAEMNLFLRWLASLKLAIEEGRIEDALALISEVERTRAIKEDPQKAPQTKRKKRFDDAYDAGDREFIEGESGKTESEVSRFRLRKNLENKAQLEEWARQNGFEPPLIRNNGLHWIIKGKDLNAHWWPSTAKLVLNQKFSRSITTHGWMKLGKVIEEFQRTGELKSLPLAKKSGKNGENKAGDGGSI